MWKVRIYEGISGNKDEMIISDSLAEMIFNNVNLKCDSDYPDNKVFISKTHTAYFNRVEDKED